MKPFPNHNQMINTGCFRATTGSSSINTSTNPRLNPNPRLSLSPPPPTLPTTMRCRTNTSTTMLPIIYPADIVSNILRGFNRTCPEQLPTSDKVISSPCISILLNRDSTCTITIIIKTPSSSNYNNNIISDISNIHHRFITRTTALIADNQMLWKPLPLSTPMSTRSYHAPLRPDKSWNATLLTWAVVRAAVAYRISCSFSTRREERACGAPSHH
mmetsp:Transcript_30266/g.56309  ORF Transcript_30266/g.56309 Transcript_30266/m.56309 type:complete len:215 (-) Transcript_30266:2974-3618(-)